MTATEFKNTIIPAYGAMLAISRKILGNEDADDVVQDVIRYLWEKHKELIIHGDPKIFALRCVRNRCIDILRCGHTQINIEELTSIPSEDSDDEIEYMRRITALNKAVDQLTEPAKSIILLNLKGKSTTEIANTTGLSDVNIRQILSRTRRKLREMIRYN